MNWMRRKLQPRLRAIALASTVLPVPGHVLDQQVAPAQEGDQGEADLVVLADDDALDVGQDLGRRSRSGRLGVATAAPRGRGDRLAGVAGSLVIASPARQVEVGLQQVAGQRRRSLAAPAAALDEHRDRDPRVLGRGEADEPRVRLALAAELGACPLLPAVVIPGPSRPRELPPESPSTASTIAAVIASASSGEITRRRLRPIVRVPCFPVIAVTRRGFISSPSFATVAATSAIWSGVTNVRAWP